jgi:hypothetical protein
MRQRKRGGIENVGKFFAREDNENAKNSYDKAYEAANRRQSHVRQAERMRK